MGVRNEPGWFVTMFSLVSQNIRQSRHSVLESSKVGLNVHLSTGRRKVSIPCTILHTASVHPGYWLIALHPVAEFFWGLPHPCLGLQKPSESSSLSFHREQLSSQSGPQLLQAFSVCEKRWCCWWWRTLMTTAYQNPPTLEGRPNEHGRVS